MKNNNLQLANYLIKLNKSLNKSINYTLNVVEWYSLTEKQDNEVKKLIVKYWNKF